MHNNYTVHLNKIPTQYLGGGIDFRHKNRFYYNVLLLILFTNNGNWKA